MSFPQPPGSPTPSSTPPRPDEKSRRMVAPGFDHGPGPRSGPRFPGAQSIARPFPSPFARTRNENFFSRLMKRQFASDLPAPLRITRPGEVQAPHWSPPAPGRPLTYWLPEAMARFARWREPEDRRLAAKEGVRPRFNLSSGLPVALLRDAVSPEGFSEQDIESYGDGDFGHLEEDEELRVSNLIEDVLKSPAGKRAEREYAWAMTPSTYDRMVKHHARFNLPQLMRQVRDHVCQQTVRHRSLPETNPEIPLDLGSDYLVLRLSGYTQTEVVESLMPDHHLAQAEYRLCDCYHMRSSGEDWARNFEAAGRARFPGAPQAIQIRLSQRRLHNLWSLGHYGRYASVTQPLASARLEKIGHFDHHVSLEALCLRWQLGAWPSALAPWATSAAAALPPARLDEVVADWKAYKAKANVIGRALAAGDGSRLVYMIGCRTPFAPEISGLHSSYGPIEATDDPFFTGGLAIDLSPPNPGIYCSETGFFPLRSTSPDDDYLAWLLAFLLMDGQTHHVSCYSVRRDALPFLPLLPDPLLGRTHAEVPAQVDRLRVPESSLSSLQEFIEDGDDFGYELMPFALRRDRTRPDMRYDLKRDPYDAKLWLRPDTPPPSPLTGSARASPAFARALAWEAPAAARWKPGKKRPRDPE